MSGFIDQLICFIFNKPYFECIIRKNKMKIGKIIQVEPSGNNGEEIALISKKFKAAWFKPINPKYFNPNSKDSFELEKFENREDLDQIIYIDGNKLVCIVDIENAIPLIEEVSYEKETVCNNLIVKTTTKKQMQVDKNKLKNNEKITNINKDQKKKREIGAPLRLKTLDFIPTMYFELLNAYFVKLTMKQPENKWAVLVPVFIVLIIVVGLLSWWILTSGAIKTL